MRLDLGVTLVLHKISYPSMTTNKDEFVIVTIFEKCEFPHTYDTSKKSWGFKAEDKKGQVYLCQWEHYDDTSSDPYAAWICEEPLDVWYDIEITPHVPRRPQFLNDTDYNTILGYCDKHFHLYYIREGCWSCNLHIGKYPTPKENWNGWY